MLELSNNSCSIMRGCQKKYYWNYIEGLRPLRKSSALSLGSVLHQAFDMYYNNFTIIEVLKYINDTMDEQLAKASPTEVEEIFLNKYILTGMWSSYPMKLDGFSKIEPEKEFRIKVPGTRGIIFVGKVDGLVTDVNGRMWVRELKTTSQTFQQFEVKARHSSQGTGYIWAMKKLGFPVNGVIYDFIKKPLLRKGINENIHQFGQRIIADYKARPDIYYKRHHTYRINDDLEMFENDLRSVAYDIRRRNKDNKWHRNPDQCWTYNSECPYLKICFNKTPDPLTVQLYYDKKQTINKGSNTASSSKFRTNSSTIHSGDSGEIPHSYSENEPVPNV